MMDGACLKEAPVARPALLSGLLCHMKPHSKTLKKSCKILPSVLLSQSELLASPRVDWSAATVP